MKEHMLMFFVHKIVSEAGEKNIKKLFVWMAFLKY